MALRMKSDRVEVLPRNARLIRRSKSSSMRKQTIRLVFLVDRGRVWLVSVADFVSLLLLQPNKPAPKKLAPGLRADTMFSLN